MRKERAFPPGVRTSTGPKSREALWMTLEASRVTTTLVGEGGEGGKARPAQLRTFSLSTSNGKGLRSFKQVVTASCTEWK